MGFNEPSIDIRKALEDAAERDRALWEGSQQGLIPFAMHVLPTENDLQPEDGVRLAREAVSKKYSLPLKNVPVKMVSMHFVNTRMTRNPFTA